MAGAAVALALLAGCGVWVQSRYPATASYDVAGRPVPGYYCYDCHGYRYFDPYYDWCVNYGFRFAWDRHPDAVRIYRERYVRIKEQNPTYGRYRYSAGYRGERRYREPRDYDVWRGGTGVFRPPAPADVKRREKDRHPPGNTHKGQKKDWESPRQGPAEKPHDGRSPGGTRPGLSGGA
jgi:hypothetical protein